MKKRYLVLILLTLISLLIFWRKQNLPEKEATIGDAVSANSNSTPRAVFDQKMASHVDPQPGDPQYADYYLKQKQLDRQFDWKRPINFYGRVVDENDQPISGVAVNFSWNDISTTGTSKAQTTSDAGGFFFLLDQKGKRLNVAVTKEGYYTLRDSKQPSFEYANPYDGLFVPDANNPVVFRLRKKGTSEPLVIFNKNFTMPKDGSAVGIELFEGKKVPPEQADMIFRCWTQDHEKDAFKRYDWKLEVQVPKGGLVESTNEFPFLAPLDGYKETDEIEMPKSLEKEWKRTFERNYFVKAKNGNYARITFRMIAHGDHFCIVGSALNPSGSRNLEFDPAVQPKQTHFE